MVGINMEDVIGVLKTCQSYIIALIVVIALVIACVVGSHWLPKPKRGFARGSVAVTGVALVVVIATMICLGPMSTLINLTMEKGAVSEKTTDKARKLNERIAEEGTVLLKNEDSALPLSQGSKLNLFGWSSENPVYSGGGSGGLNALYKPVTIEQGLKNAGFSTNAELAKFYANFSKDRPKMSIQNQSWVLPEPPAEQYSKGLIQRAKQFSGTAVITLSRVASEGHNDLPLDMSKTKAASNSKKYRDFEAGQHYLQLSHTERDLVELVCNNFDKVIVLYNGTNPMQLGFIDEHPQIKAALWCAGPGTVGFNGLGNIFSGRFNPSGRTTDTFVYDMTKTPWWNNAEKTDYSNMKDMTVDGMNAGKLQKFSPAFINYAEGIYVGYKYYETAAAEHAIDYDSTVQYPFGYGLSYTTFSQKMGPIRDSNGLLHFSVTVTNTGDKAGADVVQVYDNPPYTEGGIEKSTANLLNETKTNILKPGESQQINLSIKKDDLASYDYRNAKAYVLESGNYTISINANSHRTLDSKVYKVDRTVTYNHGIKHDGDQVTAVNRFADANGDVTYLSRANGFANYAKATARGNDVLSADLRAKYHINRNFDHNTYLNPKDTKPVTNAKNGLRLASLRGAKFDDPRWNKLLDEMSVDEMVKLTSLAGYQTAAVPSIGKVMINDADGPGSINNNFTGQGSLGMPAATMIGATWNPKLVEQYGDIMGQTARDMNVAGWYAPGVNLHRTPFGGRNFEFYSEDGVLSGIMAVNAIRGAAKHHVYAFIKHYALYDGNAKMVSIWSNEQAIRENYLKPFEMGVKDGKVPALMVSWNYIGNKWVGEDSNLLKRVLRDEWGFKGMTISDYFRNDGHGFMTADAALANGVDAMLATYGSGPNVPAQKNNASTMKYMRSASKHILYTVVNSWVYDNADQSVGFPLWKKIVVAVDAALAIILIGCEYLLVRKYRKNRTGMVTVEKEE